MMLLAFLFCAVTSALAADCPSPKICIDACNPLGTAPPLTGPPNGLGLEAPSRSMCAYHDPVKRNAKKLNKGCAESFCKLSTVTLRIAGGSPSVGDPLRVATVDEIAGRTIVTAEWAPCGAMTPTTVAGSTSSTTSSTSTSTTGTTGTTTTSTSGTTTSSTSSTSTSTTSTTGTTGATTSTTLGDFADRMGSTGSDAWFAVACESGGDCYRAGQFSGTVASLTSAGGTDWMVQKISAAGSVQWSKRFGGSSDDSALSIATNGTLVAVSGRIGSGNVDGHLVVLDASDGSTQWTKTIGSGSSSDKTTAVAMDTAGNVYTTGYFIGSFDFGTGTLSVPFTTDLDLYVAKYDSSGTVQWAEHFCDDGNGRGYGIDVAGDGSAIAVVGLFSNNLDVTITTQTGSGSCFGSTGPLAYTSTGAMTDGFVVVFNSSGVAQWGAQHAGTGNEGANAVAMDSAGRVTVVGDVTTAMNVGGGSRSALGGTDIYLVQYNSSGAYQWDHRYGGTGEDHGHGLATDASDNLYLAGRYSGTANLGAASPTSAGSTDAFLSKFTSGGSNVWTESLGGTSADVGQGASVTTTSRGVVCGYFSGSGTFSGTSLTSAGAADGFCAFILP